MKVVGKTKPVRVYELLGLKGEAPALLEKARLFEEGLARYRIQKWDEAQDIFAAVQAKFGEDPASRAYIERCRRYAEAPPGSDWDGSMSLKEK